MYTFDMKLFVQPFQARLNIALTAYPRANHNEHLLQPLAMSSRQVNSPLSLIRGLRALLPYHAVLNGELTGVWTVCAHAYMHSRSDDLVNKAGVRTAQVLRLERISGPQSGVSYLHPTHGAVVQSFKYAYYRNAIICISVLQKFKILNDLSGYVHKHMLIHSNKDWLFAWLFAW